MNALTYAINNAKFSIPMEILNIAFTELNTYGNRMISIDEKIMSGVIRPRVMVDANLVGGIHTVIDLNNCNVFRATQNEFIVDIPKEQMGGQNLISVLSLVSTTGYTDGHSSAHISSALDAGLEMMNNLSNLNVAQTARLEIIADNTVFIQDPSIYLTDGALRCVIENASNLENINPRSYPAFAKLCVLAIKAHIYNSTIVKLDKGYIYGGHELGIIKDIIDGYSEANQEYIEYLTHTWKKIAFINNTEAHGRYIKSMIGNSL